MKRSVSWWHIFPATNNDLRSFREIAKTPGSAVLRHVLNAWMEFRPPAKGRFSHLRKGSPPQKHLETSQTSTSGNVPGALGLTRTLCSNRASHVPGVHGDRFCTTSPGVRIDSQGIGSPQKHLEGRTLVLLGFRRAPMEPFLGRSAEGGSLFPQLRYSTSTEGFSYLSAPRKLHQALMILVTGPSASASVSTRLSVTWSIYQSLMILV